jgi:glucose-1-phosphate cytidylyltransferase
MTPARTRTAPEDMPVVILSGGMGTRLREETERVPKPLVEIGEKPILWHIMKIYSHYGWRRFVLCLGYKSWLIKEFFLRYREQVSDFTLEMNSEHKPEFHGDSADENWKVTCAETGLLTGTGGRLWRVRDYIDTDTFAFTYGDGIGRVDLTALLDFHYEQGRIGTVTGVHPTSRYGEMRVEGAKAVEFNEKPTMPEGFVSGGFFVFQREFLDYLTDEPSLLFEHAPLQNLARDGELAVFPHDDFWMGMDTYRDFSELNELWASGQAPWKLWQD